MHRGELRGELNLGQFEGPFERRMRVVCPQRELTTILVKLYFSNSGSFMTIAWIDYTCIPLS